MNLLKYTNGVGHLVMSIVACIVGLALVVYPGTEASTRGVGISIILTVVGAWFVPGAARQVAEQVQQQVTSDTATAVANRVQQQVSNEVVPSIAATMINAVSSSSTPPTLGANSNATNSLDGKQ